MNVVAVSGGFDPLHVGHLRMLKAAKQLGDHLVVILNNDNWLKAKKGSVFMKQKDRIEILKELKCVDFVILTFHKLNTKDMSVCKELKMLRPKVFANGGDRKKGNIPEYELCEKLNIKMMFNVGGRKVRSSSEIVKSITKVL